MDEKLENAHLLARFKLMVKRRLDQSVDLERLSRDPAYAQERLAEIEEAALDEELLVMVLRLRDIFVPLTGKAPASGEKPADSVPEMRNYKMGARAW